MAVDCSVGVDAAGVVRNRALEDPAIARFAFERARQRGHSACVLALRAEQVVDDLYAAVVDALDARGALPGTPRLAISISDAGARGPLHADDADVVVLQLRGCRRWRVFDPVAARVDVEGLILRSADRLMEHVPWRELPPVVDAVLEPGDVLYLPAYFAHTVTSTGSAEDGPLLSASAIYPVTTPAHLAHAASVPLPDALRSEWFAPLRLDAATSPGECAARLAALLPGVAPDALRSMAAHHAGVVAQR